MSAAAPKLAVIIPHYNDAARLEHCLAALLAEGLPESVEVVVVDNASPVSPERIVAGHPGVRLVMETERGAAAARNRGVAETTAPRLAFLDCDCVPGPGWLRVAIRAEVQIAGGAITVFDETPQPRSGAEAFETVFAFQQERYIREEGFTVTANMLTTRAIFERVGGFRPGLSEDADWCWRARAAGAAVTYLPTLSVAHPTRSDWPALRHKWVRIARELYGLHRDRGRSHSAWALRAVLVAGSPVRDLPKILRHPALTPGERTRAAATLIRLRLLRSRWMLTQALGREIR